MGSFRAVVLAVAAVLAAVNASAARGQRAEFRYTSAAALLPGPDHAFAAWLKGHLNQALPQLHIKEQGVRQAQEVDLDSLYNRQLKSRLQYSLGGTDVWLSGIFDRKQNGYVSILAAGQEPRYFNIRGLLDKDETLVLGTARFRLKVSPNIINQMRSQIILENEANRDDRKSATIKKLLEAVHATGEPAAVGDHSYRVFYTDQLNDGRPDPALRNIVFFLQPASGDPQLYLVPAEQVRAESVAVYKLFQDRKVGLQRSGAKLLIHTGL